jgi:hypothetical protein
MRDKNTAETVAAAMGDGPGLKLVRQLSERIHNVAQTAAARGEVLDESAIANAVLAASGSATLATSGSRQAAAGASATASILTRVWARLQTSRGFVDIVNNPRTAVALLHMINARRAPPGFYKRAGARILSTIGDDPVSGEERRRRRRRKKRRSDKREAARQRRLERLFDAGDDQ